MMGNNSTTGNNMCGSDMNFIRHTKLVYKSPKTDLIRQCIQKRIQAQVVYCSKTMHQRIASITSYEWVHHREIRRRGVSRYSSLCNRCSRRPSVNHEMLSEYIFIICS